MLCLLAAATAGVRREQRNANAMNISGLFIRSAALCLRVGTFVLRLKVQHLPMVSKRGWRLCVGVWHRVRWQESELKGKFYSPRSSHPHLTLARNPMFLAFIPHTKAQGAAMKCFPLNHHPHLHGHVLNMHTRTDT